MLSLGKFSLQFITIDYALGDFVGREDMIY